MSWREQLQAASFRTVGFFVERHDADFARRVAVHEYPGQDLPDTEDLGERATTFDLDAYVLGADYMVARDQLITALRKAGPGELVHPYLGRVDVVALGFRLTESTREGGLARLSIRFIRASELLPTVVVDTQAVASTAAEAAQVATVPAFAESWPTALGVRAAAMRAINAAFEPLETLIGNAEDWRDTLQQLINQPAAIAARLAADLARVRSLADLRRLWSFYDDTSASSRSLSLQLQASAVIAACAWSAQQVYPSYDEAVATRDELLDQLDALALRADSGLYAQLRTLRVATAADIEQRSADLARITHYTPSEVLPALVLVHRLYGPADVEARSADLIARNRLQHPGFVPVAALEVLSD